MKSIKPGRGPSMMEGISAIFMALFGLIWTILAASMGAGAFALFGVIFILMAIVIAIFSFKNATNKNRYSLFDITENSEEPDPLNERFGNSSYYNNTYNNMSFDANTGTNSNSSRFCPYCGTPAASDFEFCNSCGKKLP